jgi:hypothetical protein
MKDLTPCPKGLKKGLTEPDGIGDMTRPNDIKKVSKAITG